MLISRKLTSAPEIVSLSYRRGFIYGADCKNNRVYRIDLSGNLEVIAGTGERGFVGDGALRSMLLSCPYQFTWKRARRVLYRRQWKLSNQKSIKRRNHHNDCG